MNHAIKPKIRNIIQPASYRGQQVFLVQDNLHLAKIYEFPPMLVPLAVFCDGSRTVPEIEAAIKHQYGLHIPQPVIEDLLAQFDEVLLLESETFNQAKQQALATYRAKPARKAALAGASYPADPAALRELLQGYIDQVEPVMPSPAASRAIISPHIDYERGGPVYAQVWASVAEAVREAELIILLGTDHYGGYGTLTLTPQNYASPLGEMPTDRALVERLANLLGPERVFAEELHHLNEWSLELDLVWLQYIRGGKPCSLLPILCGSFRHFVMGQADIKQDIAFKNFVELLQEEMGQRRTVVVASGDLAHMGPAFDGPPMDSEDFEQMKLDDLRLMDVIGQGQADPFFEWMKNEQYERNVCGFSPFYFTLKLLDEAKGQTISYDRCPADQNNTSFVSVCGMIFE
jgi:AmmeMemoRadiSam system protein B